MHNVTNLERHWNELSDVQEKDFRAKSLSRILIDQFPDDSNGILDCGCGTSPLMIQALDQGYEILGIDISSQMVEVGRKLFIKKGYDPALIRLKGLLRNELEDYKDEFEVVILSDVLEHIENDLLALKESASLCCPHGFVLITVPADPILFSPRDIKLGHYRRYSRESLMKLISEAGLHVISLRSWNVLGYFLQKGLTVFGKSMNDEFRLQRGFIDKSKAALLSGWFHIIERHSWPLPGLTWIVKVGVEKNKCAE